MSTEADVKPQYGRFKDALWFPKEETTMIVGGAGGISSWLTLMLSRAGFSPVVYDFDTLEEHNLGGQLFGKNQIGMSKVSALTAVVAQFAGNDITTMNEKYKSDSMTDKYAFAGFDNMEARKALFENWVKTYGNDETALYIDGRLTFEQLQIFCIRGGHLDNISKYRDVHLFEDSEVEDAPCTLKQTSHSAAMIASHMVGFFTNFLSTLAGKESSVPFFWQYFIPLDLVNVED